MLKYNNLNSHTMYDVHYAKNTNEHSHIRMFEEWKSHSMYMNNEYIHINRCKKRSKQRKEWIRVLCQLDVVVMNVKWYFIYCIQFHLILHILSIIVNINRKKDKRERKSEKSPRKLNNEVNLLKSIYWNHKKSSLRKHIVGNN